MPKLPKKHRNPQDDQEEIKECSYYVEGTHCASCEVLIEKKLLSVKGIKSVEADAGSGKVVVEYTGERPKIDKLNTLFKKENYIFSEVPFKKDKNSLVSALVVSFVIIIFFIFLNKSGLTGLVNVNSKSSLPTFFFLGLLAGISSCAALTGGLVLSMSKQWLGLYSRSRSVFEKLQPHFMFNGGRVISYAFFGGLLGTLGGTFRLSSSLTSFLIIIVSLLMIVLAFQMLEIGFFRRFRVSLPRFVTRYVADETNFKGRYIPFLMGALTFFLPCGFTITAQGLALLSGSALLGSLIMLLFALGTTPGLLVIGVSAVKFSSDFRFSHQFSKVAGILVLFLALFNINNQLKVLGYSGFDNLMPQKSLFQTSKKIEDKDLAPIVNGKQVLKMSAFSSGYSPNYFKVRSGIPVRWEITDKGTSGCTNAIVSSGLFSGEIALTPGKVSVKEFTPQGTGKYKFSCWMGMVSGTIEVVD